MVSGTPTGHRVITPEADIAINAHSNHEGRSSTWLCPQMTVTRGYLVGGKMVMAETDKNGDGFFESVTTFDPVTDDFEVFNRQPDGAVKPISTQTLEATKKQTEVIDESLRKIFQKPNMSDQELSSLIEENQKKNRKPRKGEEG